jgi:transmembrane sensor
VAAPTRTKATITLADGRIVELDSLANGTLATQGNVKLVKLANGQIAYETVSGEIVNPSTALRMQYNTLTNPRGSKVIDMALIDGSHVWLNAGSSVTYPVVFVGNERKVSVSGEAYFEVTHNAAMPFKVSKEETTVEDLGTHFNVNAYEDEEDIKVTLLEGSVKILRSAQDDKGTLLKPGQQAVVREGENIHVVNDVDVEMIMGWKNGKFEFDKTDLTTIMRQISRWYDVEVVYEKKATTEKFGGGISRNLPLSGVLQMLENSGVHFRLEGKKLFVQ